MEAEAEAEKARDGVDAVRMTSPIVADAESYQDTRRSADARSAASDRKGPSDIADDESTDQLLRVSQAPDVFLPTGQGGKLLVTPIPASFAHFSTEGMETLRLASRRWGVAQRRVSGELLPLFVANQRRGLRSGFDQGDVSPHAALFIGAGLYQRVYERRAARVRRTYAVSLLVDASASMLSPRREAHTRSSWAMPAALLGAWTMAQLCDELQIDFEVALFNRGFAARPDDTEDTYRRRRVAATGGLRQTHGTAADRLITTVNHYVVKPFERRWRDGEPALAGLFYTAAEPKSAATLARRDPRNSPPVSLFEKAANVDEFNVIHAAERMARLGAPGEGSHGPRRRMTRGSVEALSRSVTAVEGGGTTVIGLGIGDHTVDLAYRRHEVDAAWRAAERHRRHPECIQNEPCPLGHGHLVVESSQSTTRDRRDRLPDTATFVDPSGEGPTIELERFEVPDDAEESELRVRKIPEPDPYYDRPGDALPIRPDRVGAAFRRSGLVPLHVAVHGHMGTGKDHDIEQFAAALGLPYFRIPLTGEVRDVTLIGSTRLHGDGKGGTESRWEDGDITRALPRPVAAQPLRVECRRSRDTLRPPWPTRSLRGTRPAQRRDRRPSPGRPRIRHHEPNGPQGLRRHPDPEQGLRRPLGDLGEVVSRIGPGGDDAHPSLPRAQGRLRGSDRPVGRRDQCILRGAGHRGPRGDSTLSALGPRSDPDRAHRLRRPQRSAAGDLGGVRAPARRFVRQGPLRDGMERGGAKGPDDEALLRAASASLAS